MELWRDAYLKALDFYAGQCGPRELVSIYFGGGTPSLMPPDLIEAIIQKALDLWPYNEEPEITLEANPTSTEVQKFKDFKATGVNRISLGVQSLRGDALKFLGRLHGAEDVKHALDITAATFDRYSIDLIYDRPGQGLEDWRQELAETIPYANGHISAYQLTIKEGTAFEKQVRRGGFAMSDNEHSADLFEMTQEALSHAGMPPYEVSNYGPQGQESRHNLVYWHYEDYIGIGPGAHGRVTINDQKTVSEDVRKPKDWLALVDRQGHGSQALQPLSKSETFEEAFIMGMRLYAGANIVDMARAAHAELRDVLALDKIQTLQTEGLVEYDSAKYHLRYTAKGMMCSNALNGALLK